MLRLLQHENVMGPPLFQIINVQTILLPKSREEFEDIYVVQQLMETDLSTILREQKELTHEHYEFFLY